MKRDSDAAALTHISSRPSAVSLPTDRTKPIGTSELFRDGWEPKRTPLDVLALSRPTTKRI